MISIICLLFRLASDLRTLEGTQTRSETIAVGPSPPAQHLIFSQRREKNKKCVRRPRDWGFYSIAPSEAEANRRSLQQRQGKTRTSVATRPGKWLLAGVNNGRWSWKNKRCVWTKWDCRRGRCLKARGSAGRVWVTRRWMRFCVIDRRLDLVRCECWNWKEKVKRVFLFGSSPDSFFNMKA